MICKKPKGTIDLFGNDLVLINYLQEQARNLFTNYGGQFLETPIFEKKGVLEAKIGQDNQKEIYVIANQEQNNDDNKEKTTQKEELALRFDLTVPLVRHLIENKIEKIKSSRIGKVYRRDDSSHLQLRYREFYQADFDFVGYPVGLPEIEVLMMIEDYMKLLEIDDYQIIYNYRQNLSAIYKLSGIDKSKEITVSSSIDKLDKKDWEKVKSELLDKEISLESLDKLKSFLDSNYLDSSLSKEEEIIKNLKEKNDRIIFNSSLARGLDYYTGIIFEVKLLDSPSRSVGGGGRYDRLVKDMGGALVPNLGFSFGLSRLVTFLSDEKKEKILREHYQKKLKIWIHNLPIGSSSEYSEMRQKKIELAQELRSKGYIVEYNYSKKKLTMEINYCLPLGFNLIIILGGDEYKEGCFVVKKIVQQAEEGQEQEQPQEKIQFNKLDNFLAS